MSETPTLQEPLQEPLPPILERNGFQLRNRVFSVDGVERYDGPRLQKLFNPSTLSQPQDQRYTETDTLKLFKKRFFAAQLQFYEIPFKKSSSKPQLHLLLQDAVRQGKCNRLPLSILELETIMRADHEPLQEEWEANYIAWRKEKRRRNEEAFRLARRREDEAFKLARSASERVALDPERFIATYFLTNGKQDMAKVRKPLVLRKVQNARKFEDMVKKRAPSLFIWHSRTTKDDEKANKARLRALWEQQLERHREYIAQAQLGEPSRGPNKQPEGFSLDRCKGSYVVRCAEIADEWLSFLKGRTFTMDIWSRDENILVAAFDFGLIEGTMILGMTEDLLKDDPYESDQDLEARFSDEEEEEISLEEEMRRFQEWVSGRKRKRRDEAELEAKRQAKAMRRAAEPVPEFLQHRVYLRAHGHRTDKGQVTYEPDAGHLDFRTDDCVEFAGRVYLMTWVGKNVWFYGYKVSDTPRVEPEDYDTLFKRSGLKHIKSDVKNL
ncbi:uncharacterized protein T069G_10610 [Trichoderma breve]|uniref:Uncharacterized protein n=1 Tax=Trichoderma breve TaxID=2034170 RepID=A0A9W9E3F1_9HYPO|nr:uncharacterized protein T069G_10610 [Trichoderma breve]KAJ4855052.1 hypothetical protein T069G_10610 [Trichoderma breve]